MTREEFLKKLRLKLSVLNENEIDDIINEYDGYIKEKMKNKMSEKKAVASFGNVNTLANNLLDSYKIKMQEHQSDPIGDFVNQAFKMIDKLVYIFSHKNPKEILRFVIEMLLLLFCILLCHIPISILVQLGKDVFYILSSPVNRVFFTIWRFVLEFAYLILAIVVFVKVFEVRYLNEKIESKSKKKKEENLSHITKGIIKVIVIILKIMAIFLVFILGIYLLGMAGVMIACIYLLIKGVTYFGFYLVMISLFLLGYIFYRILYNFILNVKNNGRKLFVSLLISFAILGVGCFIASKEVAETKFVSTPPDDLNTEVLTEELSMDERTVFIGNVSDYEVDNNLKNVMVEFHYYPLGNTMATNIKKSEQFVYLNWSVERLYLKKEFIDHFIKDLASKTVYNYYIEPTITITANEKNLGIIKKNRQEYYENENKHTTCNFTRTYYVEMIKDMKDKDYVSVVLSEGDNNAMESIKMKKELAKELQVGSYYEFTFQTYQSYLNIDMKEVFADNEVINIKKTDKEVAEQKQDTACTIFY